MCLFIYIVYYFARAAITKYYRMEGLNKNFSSEDWKFKIKVLADWLSQDSLLGQVATSFSWPLLCACLSLASLTLILRTLVCLD